MDALTGYEIALLHIAASDYLPKTCLSHIGRVDLRRALDKLQAMHPAPAPAAGAPRHGPAEIVALAFDDLAEATRGECYKGMHGHDRSRLESKASQFEKIAQAIRARDDG